MKVSITKFKSHLADYIRQAQTGLVVEVTLHRKVVARLAGVAKPDGTPTSRLIAAGVVTWHEGKPISDALHLHQSDTAVSQLVLDNRN